MTLLIISALMGALGNCTNKDCLLNYDKFTLGEAPYLHITGQKENCVYLFDGIFWANGRQMWGSGELYYTENGFFLESDSLGLHKVKYFDFARQVGEQYEIKFDSFDMNRPGARFAVQIERKMRDSDGDEIFIFNIQNGYNMEGFRGDLVFLVSKKTGILGSYITGLDNGESVIIAPMGNILEDVIDYSDFKFRSIE